MINNKFIKSNGTEKITIIHLNESTPPINISKEGWMTNKNAKIRRKLPELSTSDFFIEAEARTYEEES